MIENGVLTYGAREEGILTWRFSNDVLNEVVIAALLTFISYQTIETIINFSFGLKARGRAKLRDIQIMLLIRKSSPMAILRAISPWQRRRRKDVPEIFDDMSETDTDMGHDRRVSAYLKLFCLLLAIPLVNVGSVVLSLERDKYLTFAEGQFGGLAFGLDFNRSITDFAPISRIPQGFCDGTTLQTNTAEFPIALFRLCVRDITSNYDPVRNDTIIISVKGTPVDLAFVSVTVGSQKILYEKEIMIISEKADTLEARQGGQLHFVKANFKSSEAQILVDQGVKLAQSFCDYDDEMVINRSIEQGAEEGNFTVSASGECPRKTERSQKEDLESAKTVALDLLSRLSFVDSDKLLVRLDDAERRNDFFNGDDLLLLSRRRALVSIPLMAILALAAVLLRIVAQLTTNNDLERGIGLIVRDGLGLPCCDSMLCSPDVIAQYDSNGLILYDVDRSYAGREKLEASQGKTSLSPEMYEWYS